jgi:uncharacterized membrane protein
MLFNIWKISVLFIGLALIVVVPPFHSPDEFNHFYKAYHISSGYLTPGIDYNQIRLGGRIPQSLVDVSIPYTKGVSKLDYKFSKELVVKYSKVKLRKDEKIYGDFINTARYAPTAYVPQVLAISICKIFDINPLIMMYCGRLFNFLVWYIILFFAIKRTPIFKGGLMLLSALPTSLAINSTMNADVISNALAFLAISCFFRLRMNESTTKKDLYMFSIAVLIVTLNKLCYFPLMFLLLFVDKKAFTFTFSKFKFITLNLILNVAIILIWAHLVDTWTYPTNEINVTSYHFIRPDANVNPKLQMQRVLENFPTFTIALVFNSFTSYIITWETYLSCFGWEFGRVPRGMASILLFSIFIYFLFQKHTFKPFERILLFIIGHGMIIFFLVIQHLSWDSVGPEMIQGYGGKYYISIYPIILLSMAGIFSKISERAFFKNYLIKYSILPFLCIWIVVYWSFFQAILDRYYA